MNATTIAAPITAGPSWTQATRVALAALAIVVLLAVSFVLGRATVSTAEHLRAITPATTPAIVPPAVALSNTPSCQVRRPC